MSFKFKLQQFLQSHNLCYKRLDSFELGPIQFSSIMNVLKLLESEKRDESYKNRAGSARLTNARPRHAQTCKNVSVKWTFTKKK